MSWPTISAAVEVALEPHGAGGGRRRTRSRTRPGWTRHSVMRRSSGISTELHARAVGQTEDQLAAAVLGRRRRLDLRQRGLRRLGQARTEVPRQVGHGVEVDDALAIDPGRDLAAPVARGAQRPSKIFEGGREGSDEIRARHRREEYHGISARTFSPRSRCGRVVDNPVWNSTSSSSFQPLRSLRLFRGHRVKRRPSDRIRPLRPTAARRRTRPWQNRCQNYSSGRSHVGLTEQETGMRSPTRASRAIVGRSTASSAAGRRARPTTADSRRALHAERDVRAAGPGQRGPHARGRGGLVLSQRQGEVFFEDGAGQRVEAVLGAVGLRVGPPTSFTASRTSASSPPTCR